MDTYSLEDIQVTLLFKKRTCVDHTAMFGVLLGRITSSVHPGHRQWENKTVSVTCACK